MGKNQDFLPEEIKFLVRHFMVGWSDKDIAEEIQEKTEFPCRSVRSISKIRKIYKAMEEPVKEACTQAVMRELRDRISEEDRDALGKLKESIRDGSFFLEI